MKKLKKIRYPRKAKCACCKRILEITDVLEVQDDMSNLIGDLNLCHDCARYFVPGVQDKKEDNFLVDDSNSDYDDAIPLKTFNIF